MKILSRIWICLGLALALVLASDIGARGQTSAFPSSNENITRYFDVKAFCASGSQQQTTGSLSGDVLALKDPADFAVCPPGSGQPGEGITIYHAGNPPSISAPTGVTATVVGAAGTTTHSYRIAASDYFGGATAATSPVTVTTAYARMSAVNYVKLCFKVSAGAGSYSIYRDGRYLVTTFDSTPSNEVLCYKDAESTYADGSGWGNSTGVKPDWLPATPSMAVNDWCQTTIASGAGTSSVKLSAPCPSSVSAQIVKHDDTTAVQAAIDACNTSQGGVVNFDLDGNFNVAKINWPDSRTPGRGWIIFNLQGQITITYPLTFGSPHGHGYSQNKIRITGNSGGNARSSQFPFSNAGFISSGFTSPVIHIVYENSTGVFPIVIDHISINNFTVGGGDGIVTDTGGSIYINNVDVVTTGTALKAGYLTSSGTLLGGTGSCRFGSGFGLYVDHSTFTTQFNGNPLTNCDGWTLDITLGQAYFDTITLINQGIHTMQLGGQNDFNSIYEESGSTAGFLTWDTSEGQCNPQCGSNSFRHVELADPAAPGANKFFINTVNGGATPLGQVDFESVEGVESQLVGGTTPIAGCSINQNGPTSTNLTPGKCYNNAGVINGRFSSTNTSGSGINLPPNMTIGTGLNAFYSLSLGPVISPGNPNAGTLALQGPTGYTGNYMTCLDPTSTVSRQTADCSIDGNYNFNTIGIFKSTKPTGTAPIQVTSTTVNSNLNAGLWNGLSYRGTGNIGQCLGFSGANAVGPVACGTVGAIGRRDPPGAQGATGPAGASGVVSFPAFIHLTTNCKDSQTWALGNSSLANATITLTGACKINITGPISGGNYILEVMQGLGGGHTLTLGTGCTWKVSGGGGGTVTPSAAAGSLDVLAFTYDGSSCLATYNKLFN